jgi:dUTP pyrophosphatase
MTWSARPVLRVQRLPHSEGLPLPRYETAGAAGLDLRAALDAPLVLQSLDRIAVPTGLIVAIPPGFEGQVRPRSGLALRKGLGMPNSPGTIDADYRGELKVLMVNLGREPIEITRGMRIAQLVIAPVAQAELVEVQAISDETDRGEGGFGSTGV